MCPKGDDPLTLNQEAYSLSLSIKKSNSSVQFSGSLGIEFLGVKFYFAIASGDTSSFCETAFESSKLFTYVSCLCQLLSSTHMKCDVQLISWPILPTDNNIFSHNGAPFASEFTCDISQTDSDVYCSFFKLESEKTFKGIL